MLNIIVGKFTKRDNALNTMVTTLKEQIEEFKGKLIICKDALGNRVLVAS